MRSSAPVSKAGNIIDQSMKALGIAPNMQTDPAIARSVLQEMKLDDFKTTFPPMQKFLKDVCTKPQKLRSMFECIKDGIIQKHPAIVEFAELALSKKWFAPSNHIQRAVHVTYILEAMTAAMCNNPAFFIAVQNHIRTKELECKVNSRNIPSTLIHVVRITHKLFETMKGLSVDVTMVFFRLRYGLSDSYACSRQHKTACNREKLNYIESKLLTPSCNQNLEHVLKWIRINIYEAGITEFRNGYSDNALCSQVLSEDILRNPPATLFQHAKVVPEHCTISFYNSLSKGANLFPKLRFSQKWVQLYIAWNLAFLLSDVDDLDLALPSLYIPSIIGAKDEHFMSVRGISLWLTVNSLFFRTYEHSKVVPGPTKRSEMAQAWGAINKKYALELARNETQESRKTLMQGYRRFFSHPYFNFLKLLGDFVVH